MPRASANPLFDLLRQQRLNYDSEDIVALFQKTDAARVRRLGSTLGAYIASNLPKAIDKRGGLTDYRTNPYVLLTCANVMKLEDPARFADFLFNNKLYMGLETSFGKSIEAKLVGEYPIGCGPAGRWQPPPEKVAESTTLAGLSRESRAHTRKQSLWREVDRSCVGAGRRYLVLIKSGPNCINDTQVQAMTDAIVNRHYDWMRETRHTYPAVKELDIVIGVTYGTPRTTNNKDNQILVKLLEAGFAEEDRLKRPGVLIHDATRTTRVYRLIGRDFRGFIGKPAAPQKAQFVFLEVLLALAKALAEGMSEADLEQRINRKTQALALAISKLMFQRNSLPEWVRQDLTESQLFWFATALSAFHDEGI